MVNFHRDIENDEERIYAVWRSFFGALMAYGRSFSIARMTDFINDFRTLASRDELIAPYVNKFIGACSAFYGIYYDKRADSVVRIKEFDILVDLNLVNFDGCICLDNLATLLSRLPSGETDNEKLQRILIKSASLLYALNTEEPDFHDFLCIKRYLRKDREREGLSQYEEQLCGVLSFEFGLRMSKDSELTVDRSALLRCSHLLGLDVTQYIQLKKLASPSTKKPVAVCGESAIYVNLFTQCIRNMKRSAIEMQSAERIKATDKALLAKYNYETAKSQAEYYLERISNNNQYKRILEEAKKECLVCSYKQNTVAPTKIIFTPAGGKTSR